MSDQPRPLPPAGPQIVAQPHHSARQPRDADHRFSRAGLKALKATINIRGLAVIDKRTAGARGLLEWRTNLLDDLGGESQVSAAQFALVEDAVRTKLLVDHVDAFLLEKTSLIAKKRRRLVPLVLERMKLADHLARVLQLLGLERKPPKIPDLNTYLAERYGPRPASSAPVNGPAEASEPPLGEPASPGTGPDADTPGGSLGIADETDDNREPREGSG